MPGDVTVAQAPQVTKDQRASEHRFYLGVGALVILLSVLGFGPSIAQPSTRNVPLPLTALVAIHAVAASAWLLLFMAQTTLVATGRTTTHRRLGLSGVVVATVFVISGCVMSVEKARRGFDLSGDLVRRDATVDPSFILAPINAFVLFAVLVGAALWYRRRPDVHKRLMGLAMLGGLTGAPIAHLVGHYPGLQAGGGALAPISGLALLSLNATFDRLTYGRIHPVSLWGAIGSFGWLIGFFTLVMPTSVWRDFTRWAIQRAMF